MAFSGECGPLQYASGTDTDDGDYSTPLVAAQSGKKIRVLQLTASVLTTAGTFSLKGGAATWAMHLALGSPLVVSTQGVPVYETATGAALTPSNGSGVDSFCNVTWCTVEP